MDDIGILDFRLIKKNYGTLFFTEYKSAYVSETPIIYHSMARSSPMGVVMPAKVRFKSNTH